MEVDWTTVGWVVLIVLVVVGVMLLAGRGRGGPHW